MAQLTALSDLTVKCVPHLKGCDAEFIAVKMKDVVRTFFHRTQAWREDLDNLHVVFHQEDYDLTSQHQYTAQINRIISVRMNGQTIHPAHYVLYRTGILRLDRHASPVDEEMEDQLLSSAAAITTETIATWQAITDGAITFDVEGSNYALTGLSFAACGDLDDVAAVIQAALRTSLADNRVTCRFHGAAGAKRFVAWVDSGYLGYVAAPSEGTDLTFHLNMAREAAQTLSPNLQVAVVFRPDDGITALPAWLIDRYGDGLAAGTVAALAQMLKMPWGNADVFKLHQSIYHQAVNEALGETWRDGKQVTGGVEA